MSKNFRIYPSLGIARLGNGKADQNDAVFSPEVPWANLYKTDQNYLTADGKIKKQAQRFYIYECDDNGKPIGPISESDYSIVWTAEVANKKPFWYDFNNSLDLSVQLENHNNLSPNFFDKEIAPGISASYRNPNVLDESLRIEHGKNFRKELVNSPGPVSVSSTAPTETINGKFPYPQDGASSAIAAVLDVNVKDVPLGSLEYDKGTLLFYGADGTSASLNPSDLNTDFADNSNWYDDICDGRITATITPTGGGTPIQLNTADSAAWVASAPPDYAPQIQPISNMYDLITGASDDTFPTDFSTVFPVFYRLYRMQWVNLGDFLAPSFRETIDKLIADGQFQHLYHNDSASYAVRNMVFNLFRDPLYNYNNEPIIPSKEMTDLIDLQGGTEDIKLPYYPGDGINYPGSPAQWFAIPPLLYEQLKNWRDGDFRGPKGTYDNMDAIGKHYQQQFHDAAQDESKKPLLMTRAVLETLYGGGFHPGVELTWPFRHAEMYSENRLVDSNVMPGYSLFGLREIRVNSATPTEQHQYFYKDFGLQINVNDVKDSLISGSGSDWLWKLTPGDLTKWMGIPWQSDAGSCQAVFLDSQYPVPAWWAANLPVDVLTEESLSKMQDASILPETRQNIYANRLPWLKTTDTGFVGYHAEGGYMNGLISMVYQWKDIGMVTGRPSGLTDDPNIPETVYVSFDTKNRKDRLMVFLGKAIAQVAVDKPGNVFYTNTRGTIWIPESKDIILSSQPDGTGDIYVDDNVAIHVNGETQATYEHDFSNGCSGRITPLPPQNLNSQFADHRGHYVTITISYNDKCGAYESASNFYLVFK